MAVKGSHAATAIIGGVLAVMGGISLLKSRSKLQGQIRMSLMVLGLSLLPVSLILYVKSKD